VESEVDAGMDAIRNGRASGSHRATGSHRAMGNQRATIYEPRGVLRNVMLIAQGLDTRTRLLPNPPEPVQGSHPPRSVPLP
jgi:hypothetical protein